MEPVSVRLQGLMAHRAQRALSDDSDSGEQGGEMRSLHRSAALSVLGFALMIAHVPHTDAATLETRSVRDWTMGAYTSDETGAFSHCTIYAEYRNGVVLLMAIDRDFDYTLGFSTDAFSFAAGDEIPVDVSVDGHLIGRTAYVISSDHVSVFINEGSRAINRLKRGRRITARIDGETYLFDLDNSAYALGQAEECVAGHVRRGSRTKPVPTTQEPVSDEDTAAGSDDRSAARLEATLLSANLLGRLSLDAWTLRAPEAKPEKPDVAGRYDAFWESADAIGGVMLFLPDEATPTTAKLRRDIVSDDAARCAGNFTSAQTASTAPGVHFVVSCTAIEDPWSSFYSIIDRPGGGRIVFATASAGKDLAVASTLGLETATRAHETVRRTAAPAQTNE